MKLLPDRDVLAPWTFLHPNGAALFIFCLATQPGIVCFLLQEDELSGVSSALWLHADSAALGCHCHLMHLLFESEGAVVLMPGAFIWE